MKHADTIVWIIISFICIAGIFLGAACFVYFAMHLAGVHQ